MGGILGTGGDILPDYERVPVNDVQVSLHRLLKLLRSTGRSTGFLLSGAIVPIIDVRRLIEDEFAGSLDPSAGDTAAKYADGVGIGGAAFSATKQLFNPSDSGVTVELFSAAVSIAIDNITLNVELHDGAFPIADGNGVLVRGPAILGGANDDCQARMFEQDGTGVLPNRLKVIRQQQFNVAGDRTFELMSAPVWIPPGRGVCVRNVGFNAGTNFIANFRFKEYPRT